MSDDTLLKIIASLESRIAVLEGEKRQASAFNMMDLLHQKVQIMEDNEVIESDGEVIDRSDIHYQDTDPFIGHEFESDIIQESAGSQYTLTVKEGRAMYYPQPKYTFPEKTFNVSDETSIFVELDLQKTGDEAWDMREGDLPDDTEKKKYFEILQVKKAPWNDDELVVNHKQTGPIKNNQVQDYWSGENSHIRIDPTAEYGPEFMATTGGKTLLALIDKIDPSTAGTIQIANTDVATDENGGQSKIALLQTDEDGEWSIELPYGAPFMAGDDLRFNTKKFTFSSGRLVKCEDGDYVELTTTECDEE